MNKKRGTSKDYTREAYFWSRTKPKIQSDFLCRPYIFGLLKNVKNKTLADIGCGEGYVSRYFASRGAKVTAVDNSKGLISSAKKREHTEKLGINYFVGSALNLEMIKSNSVDYVVSVLVFGHFDSSKINKAIQETNRVLKKSGYFILAVPHPFIYICKPKSNWIKFNYNKLNYWESDIAEISLYTKDKIKFDISAKHHTLEKYLNSLSENSFIIEKIVEPQAKKNDMKIYKDMWGEENSLPTYLIIRAKKI